VPVDVTVTAPHAHDDAEALNLARAVVSHYLGRHEDGEQGFTIAIDDDSIHLKRGDE
jgi:hypothetical protein